jgi:hypothetical protein
MRRSDGGFQLVAVVGDTDGYDLAVHPLLNKGISGNCFGTFSAEHNVTQIARRTKRKR